MNRYANIGNAYADLPNEKKLDDEKPVDDGKLYRNCWGLPFPLPTDEGEAKLILSASMLLMTLARAAEKP